MYKERLRYLFSFQSNFYTKVNNTLLIFFDIFFTPKRFLAKAFSLLRILKGRDQLKCYIYGIVYNNVVANVAMYFEYISEKGIEIPHVCISAHA